MTDLCGWLGALCLGLCGLPQAVKTLKTRKANDISAWFLGLWFAGEVLMVVYVWPKMDLPLLLNYALNIGIILVISRFKI